MSIHLAIQYELLQMNLVKTKQSESVHFETARRTFYACGLGDAFQSPSTINCSGNIYIMVAGRSATPISINYNLKISKIDNILDTYDT
jgi:hypothetical protein